MSDRVAREDAEEVARAEVRGGLALMSDVLGRRAPDLAHRRHGHGEEPRDLVGRNGEAGLHHRHLMLVADPDEGRGARHDAPPRVDVERVRESTETAVEHRRSHLEEASKPAVLVAVDGVGRLDDADDVPHVAV